MCTSTDIATALPHACMPQTLVQTCAHLCRLHANLKRCTHRSEAEQDSVSTPSVTAQACERTLLHACTHTCTHTTHTQHSPAPRHPHRGCAPARSGLQRCNMSRCKHSAQSDESASRPCCVPYCTSRCPQACLARDCHSSMSSSC